MPDDEMLASLLAGLFARVAVLEARVLQLEGYAETDGFVPVGRALEVALLKVGVAIAENVGRPIV
jgi:hypothetical protein